MEELSIINFFGSETDQNGIINWANKIGKNRDAITKSLQLSFSHILIEGIINIEEIITNKIEPAYKELMKAGISNPALGSIGFCLFSFRADSLNYSEADAFLENKDVRNFIYDEYSITDEKYRFDQIKLHKTGTTSYILKYNLEEIVIKIIKYRFLENHLITNQTKEYKSKFKGHDMFQVPKIYHSGPRYIIMEYIGGLTLKEYLNQLTKSEKQVYIQNGEEKIYLSFSEHLNITTQIFSQLCEVLKSFAQTQIFHHDLSPYNIIIHDLQNGQVYDRQNVYLIDFGSNYLLKERIGSNRTFTQLESYIPPELIDPDGKGSVRSDIYSLGMLLLESLSSDKLTLDRLSPMLDEIWRKYPGYAKLIEELIDTNPATRLFNIPEYTLYPHIINRLQYESAFYEITEKDKKSIPFLDILSNIFILDFSIISKLVDKTKLIKNKGYANIKLNTEPLVNYSVLAQALNIVIIALFCYYLFEEKDYKGLPGRIVGISFSLVATRYYQNIFSSISIRRINKLTNFFIRFNSWCFSIPVLWALIVNPEDWPFCAAVGVFFVTINNFLCYKLAGKAQINIKEALRLPPSSSINAFFSTFYNWPYLMFLYAIGLVVVGILLDIGVAKDEFIYAVIVAAINLLNMYYTNCTKDAPTIRGGLERLFFGMERANGLKVKQVTEPLKVIPQEIVL